jgi:hypothetical protein
VSAIAGIVAFFNALPALLELINRLGLVLERLTRQAEQNNLNAWITKLEVTIDQLESAKTTEEKLSAAKGLVDVIHGLGPRPQ